MEGLVVKTGGIPVEIQKSLPPPSGFPVPFLLRDFQSCALGKKTYRIGKGKVLLLHDEIDDAAAALAAETIVDLLIRGDGEGTGFFTVEGTKAKQVGALPGQLNIAAYHVHNITAGDELVQKALGKCHCGLLLSVSFAKIPVYHARC